MILIINNPKASEITYKYDFCMKNSEITYINIILNLKKKFYQNLLEL